MTPDEQGYLYKSIGKQIKSLRNRSRISQEELADKLGLSRASVVNIEKGRQHASLHLLMDLSRIFKVSLQDFLTEEFSGHATETGIVSRRKREISKVTSGDSIKMVSEFLEEITSKKPN
jgi:transcriptional regulator with XRE-family HTH domain